MDVPHRRDGARRQTAKSLLEATPLVVDGTMYLSRRSAASSRSIRRPARSAGRTTRSVDRDGNWGDFANRGVSTWLDPQRAAGAPCRRRIYLATIDARIIALDARREACARTSATQGSSTSGAGCATRRSSTAEYELTSPPAVVNGLDRHRLGDRRQQPHQRARAAKCARSTRAPARCGGRWDPVPRDSTDPALATWRGAMAHRTGAANAWSVIAADSARDLVFVPTGSASPDYYGGERLGDNRYANSIVALRASTGKVVWHFQTVHHDLWDYDNASPPALVTVSTRRPPRRRRAPGDEDRPALRARPRHRQADLPGRGEPGAASTVAGRARVADAAVQYRHPTALARSALSSTACGAPTPRIATRVSRRFAGLRNDGPFTPPSLEGSLVLPSNIGGAHWGGVAFDPSRQIAVVPTNTVAAVIRLIPRAQYDSARRRGTGNRIGAEFAPQRGTPYGMYRELLLLPTLAPCTAPPFGALVGVDLRRGTIAWRVPLGTMTGAAIVGAPNLGGAITTAGGVTFVAATIDRQFRAVETRTGRGLWHTSLPAAGKATPMTFRGASGRQYVVISAGGDGGGAFGVSDAIVAFALAPGR